MSTLKDRLDAAIAHANTSAAEVARACGISEAAVSKWRSGATSELKSAHVFAVARACHVDAEWLATGKGKMFGSSQNGLEPRHVALIQAYRLLPQEQRTPIRMLIEALHAALDPKQREWSISMDEHNKKRDGKPAKEKT